MESRKGFFRGSNGWKMIHFLFGGERPSFGMALFFSGANYVSFRECWFLNNLPLNSQWPFFLSAMGIQDNYLCIPYSCTRVKGVIGMKLLGFSIAMLDEKDDRRKMTTWDLTFRKRSELRNGKSLFGEDSHFDYYFSDGLKPPTRSGLQDATRFFVVGWRPKKIRAGRWKHPSSFTLLWWTRLHDASTGTEGFRGMGIWSWNLNIIAIQFIYVVIIYILIQMVMVIYAAM